MSAGAVSLCIVGYSTVIDSYDGWPSLFNVVAASSCCCALVLVLTALPVAWLVHEAFRER